MLVDTTPVWIGETCADALEEPWIEIGPDVDVWFAVRDTVSLASGVLKTTEASVVGPFRVTVSQERNFFCTSATKVLPAGATAVTVHDPATNWDPSGVRLVVEGLEEPPALGVDNVGTAVGEIVSVYLSSSKSPEPDFNIDHAGWYIVIEGKLVLTIAQLWAPNK